MAAASRSAQPNPPTIISLLSDDEEDDDDEVPIPMPRHSPMAQDFVVPLFQTQPAPAPQRWITSGTRQHGDMVIIDGEEVYIPTSPGSEIRRSNADTTVLSSDSCLQQVLAIFPDVCPEHVTKLYNDMNHADYGTLSVPSKFEMIVDSLVSAERYPKQAKGKGPEHQLKRKHVETNEDKRGRKAEKSRRKSEAVNLRCAIAAGQTAECQACFEEMAMNRQIHCDGEIAHFTCFNCATTYIKSEVGDSRCRVLCTAGCGAGFTHAQLHLLEDKQLLERLEQLQQERDIRDAGLEDLEVCPFCDYKAILPPVEEDFEFRCANPCCEKTSCRRCKGVSHVPLSCDEHAKNNKLDSRHKIEEAMTAAMVRSCNKCRKVFIKDYGCNKMCCPSCGNLQCYVCSAPLKGYSHFDQSPGGARAAQFTNKSKRCPLYDNVEERHEREVRAAEVSARAQVMRENPDVSEQDLEIKVSDAVDKATKDQIRQAAPHGFGGGGGEDARLLHNEAFGQAPGHGHAAQILARPQRHALLQQRLHQQQAMHQHVIQQQRLVQEQQMAQAQRRGGPDVPHLPRPIQQEHALPILGQNRLTAAEPGWYLVQHDAQPAAPMPYFGGIPYPPTIPLAAAPPMPVAPWLGVPFALPREEEQQQRPRGFHNNFGLDQLFPELAQDDFLWYQARRAGNPQGG